MQRTVLMVIVAGLVTMGLMSLTAEAQNRGGARPVAAAVVDVESVFENLDEQAAVKADLTSQISNLQKWEQGQQKAIKAKQGELDVLPPESKEFQQAQADMEQMAIGLQVELQFRQRQIERAKALQTENLYRKILAMVERVAKAERYDLVLFKDKTPNMAGANQQQVAMLIQTRKLLYSAPDLDITDQITQKLNNEFNNAGGN
jgi:Skp family chaperone for outer membrane proteins